MSLDVTSASTFSGGYGSENKTIAMKSKKVFFQSSCPGIKRNLYSSPAKNSRSMKEAGALKKTSTSSVSEICAELTRNTGGWT